MLDHATLIHAAREMIREHLGDCRRVFTEVYDDEHPGWTTGAMRFRVEGGELLTVVMHVRSGPAGAAPGPAINREGAGARRLLGDIFPAGVMAGPRLAAVEGQ
jgi:hypothetical protein